MTGDFDICTPWGRALDEELQRADFVRPTGTGQLSRGWIHPDLRLGLEIVASIPMDGNVDADHVLLVEDVGDGASFAIIAVEDLIADRMGQYASGTASDRLDQAQILFALHPAVDRDYLDRRIRQETAGEYGVEALKD